LRPKFHHITTSPIKFHQTNTNPPSRHEFHHLSPQNTIFTIANCASNTHRATGELQTFLAIAFLTGARAGEILALHKSDIDFHNATIIIDKNQTRYELTTPKNGRPRTIHAPRELIAHLKNANLSDGRIFTSDYFQIYYAFQKLLKCLKFAPCGLHITRYSYATLLMQNAISPLFIAQNLGHSDANLVNRIYSHYIFDKV
jgi:putative site-specific recombinase, phage integrase family